MKHVSFISRIIDLIAPRQCPVCDNRLGPYEEVICASCNMRLPRTEFFRDPVDNEMARLFWGRIPIERAAAWLRFEPHSEVARLVYAMKYGHHPDIGETVGELMVQELETYKYHDDRAEEAFTFFEGIDAIIPIPLTSKRKRQRGYNQSETIAQGISNKTGIPILKDVVRRTSFHESQTQKDWWERKANVQNVFHLVIPDKIVGRHILLVDDIVTTGATIISCAGELKKAGNVRFSVLTIGYTKV